MIQTLVKIKLITRTKSTKDARNQWNYTETARDVYARPAAVTRNEYYTAGQIGISPDNLFIISAFDYHDETLLEYNGQKMRIYRTYPRNENEIEIYCTYAAGAN